MTYEKTAFLTVPRALTAFLFNFLFSQAFSQEAKHPFLVDVYISGKDTFPMINLNTVDIVDHSDVMSAERYAAYLKLRNNIIKVMPYAKLAAAKIKEINDKQAAMKNNRQRNRYVKEQNELLKTQFQEELENLTVTQGRILIKLIDRETGHTTYALVKDLQGTLHAMFWQTVARFWGNDIKASYDPSGEDQQMEQIISQLDKDHAWK